MAEYSTIVADPPWHYEDRMGRFPDPRSPKTRVEVGARKEKLDFPYPTMTVEEIADLPVSNLAAKDAHLYLWATTRYLRDAYTVAEAWGFPSVSAVLVWCKASKGFAGGAFVPNVEFVLFCRRGRLAHKEQVRSRWFEWARGPHSAKPEAFLDMVERVSPGPYLELFARRNRLGWHTWGNQALEHEEIA